MQMCFFLVIVPTACLFQLTVFILFFQLVRHFLCFHSCLFSIVVGLSDVMSCTEKCRFISSFRILLIFLLINCCCYAIVSDVQSSSFLTDDDDKPVFTRQFSEKKTYQLDDCIPVAFGDFNADRIIDIFCRNTLGNQIQVMLNDDRSPTSEEQCFVTIPYVWTFVNCIYSLRSFI